MAHLECIPPPAHHNHHSLCVGAQVAANGQGIKDHQKTVTSTATTVSSAKVANGKSRKPTTPKAQNDKGPNTNGMCQPQPVPSLISEDTLNTAQRDKLAELRAALGDELLRDTALFNDTYSLLRWLIGWNNNIDEIVPRFRRASALFRCLNLNTLCIEDIDALNEYTRSITGAAEYYPGGVMSYDREGNVVSLQCMGRSHPKKLARCGRVSDVYRLVTKETVLVYQLIRIQERKRRRKLGLKVIIDLEGFSTDHLSPLGLKVYANSIHMMQEMFPDILRQVYVINAHYLVKTAYNVVKPALSEQSREKVVFLDSAYQEVLVRDIGAENLLRAWGGTRVPKGRHPEGGSLRMGGIPPAECRYLPAKNPAHVDEAKLTKLAVPAKQKREVDITVPRSADAAYGTHQLHWYFLSNGDISFGVVDADNKEVWPMFHLLTDCCPEYGSVTVQDGASYRLLFDNSYGTFFGREVRYAWRLKKTAAAAEKQKKNGVEEEKENAAGEAEEEK